MWRYAVGFLALSMVLDARRVAAAAEPIRRKLEQREQAAEQPVAVQHEFTFATMSDGVKIALAVGYPRGFLVDSDRRWPAVLSLCGYPSATVPIDPGRFGHRCVTVNMSIRGSGASGGKLSPWVPRSRQDGYEIIEDWIVKQPWSNGKVGIFGHSWPGLMGFLVSTTAPPSLRAVCVSGLIEDFYRGIARVGGVRNCGFPVDWLNSYYALEGPFGSGEAARQIRGLDDVAYRRIIDSRPARDLRNDILWSLMHEPLDAPKFHDIALRSQTARIRAPILIGQSYQDEQTGPSGWWLWKHVPEDVPKRLFLSNGNHGVTPVYTGHLEAWLQHWLLGEGDGRVADPQRRVQVYFETVRGDGQVRFRFNRPLEAPDFPLPGTRWTRLYLRSGKTFSAEPPDQAERPDVYRIAHGALRGVDERVEFSLEVDEPTAICGPIVLSLWAKTTTIDTDLFALVADLDPDGNLYGLQRGLLRASHRQLEKTKSVYVVQDEQELLIRPWHSHSSVDPVKPHEPCRYKIEIPVVGHVFRPGHRLVLRLSRPPEGDPIGVTRSGAPSYRYDSDPPPGAVQILHSAEHPSSLLLPVLPELPPVDDTPPPLADQAGLQRVAEE